MSEINFSYYQFNKDLGYQIYLRFEDLEFETQLGDVLGIMGFDKVERDNVKNINFDPLQTKVLKITKASPGVSRQITRSDFLSDKYGPESVSKNGRYNVYRYKKVAMMVFSENSGLWELGIKDIGNHDALRVIFTRFLSYALAPVGVVGFWGVPVDEGFVVMSPKAANFEAIFVDIKKNVVITFDGVKSIDHELQILRLDSTLANEARPMSREALISFLTVNTNYLSQYGLSSKIKNALYAICKIADAYIYPQENFKPRQETERRKAA
jgi:hypothetical protein